MVHEVLLDVQPFSHQGFLIRNLKQKTAGWQSFVLAQFNLFHLNQHRTHDGAPAVGVGLFVVAVAGDQGQPGEVLVLAEGIRVIGGGP